MNKFLSQIRQKIDIKARSSETTILCKDEDKINTKEEIRETLEKGFNFIGLEVPAIKT